MKKSNLTAICSVLIITFFLITGTAFGTDSLKIDSSGNVGIGVEPSSSYKLYVYGSSGSYPARVGSPNGYLILGPHNTSYSHFLTDRPLFYFNTGIKVNTGLIGSYDEDLSLQTSGTTRMTIDSSTGKVGIGTTNPEASLHVTGNNTGSPTVHGVSLGKSGDYASIELKGASSSTGGGFIDFGYPSNDYKGRIIYYNSYDKMYFYTGGTSTAELVLDDYKVGLSTTPKSSLTFWNNVATSPIDSYDEYQLLLYDSGTAAASYGIGIEGYTMWFNTYSQYKFYRYGSTLDMILKNGNLGIGYSDPGTYKLAVNGYAYKSYGGGTWAYSSDIRIKKDVKKLTNATDIISDYPKPILYKWENPEEHEDTTREVIGLSAQDLEAVNPEMVVESDDISKDGELTDGKTKAIFFSNEFFALQLGAVQELIERVEALEEENQLIKTELCKKNNSYSFCK